MKWTLVILLSLNFSTADSPNSDCSVSAEEGATVILPVKVDLPEDSELVPIIKWEKEGGVIVHEYWYTQDNNKDQSVHFKNRTSLFKDEFKKGNFSLKISNVTKNDTGKYTCEVHLHKGNNTSKVFLRVLEISERGGPTESPKPEQSFLTSGQIVGTVIGVLIVLAALIGAVFLYRRCKATKRRHGDAEVDNQEMETLNGAGSVL